MAERTWRPHIEHPLQPAPHFHGRRALLAALQRWLGEAEPRVRVVSLVAIGGAGKTALAEQLVRDLRGDGRDAGVFVWSFYENHRTEDFLARACEYFASETHVDAQVQLHRLQRALDDGRRHMLVLDGIELVQETAADPRRLRGSLTDPLLKRLLRSVADGLGRSRMVITSRLPLPDLRYWEGARGSHWSIALESLDPSSAVELFRAWNVRGEREDLVRLGEQVGFHALSVAALAAYLGEMCDGDPAGASGFDLASVATNDALAAKLARVLSAYAVALSPAQRQTLASLSTLARGVDVEQLAGLVQQARPLAIAGELGAAQPRGAPAIADVERDLERLQALGLVYSYRKAVPRLGARSRHIYTAHPFVRDYFRSLVDVETVHADLASLLRPTVANAPGGRPTSPEELERAEQYLEHLVAANDHAAAVAFYQSLGGFERLASLDQQVRARRMLELIGPVSGDDSYFVVRERAHGARAMGELDLAQDLYNDARGRFVAMKMTLEDLQEEADDFARLFVTCGALGRALDPLPLIGPSPMLAGFIDLLRIGGRVQDHAADLVWAPNLLTAPWSTAVRTALLANTEGDEHALIAGHLALLDIDRHSAPLRGAARPGRAGAFDRAQHALGQLQGRLTTTAPPHIVVLGHHLAACAAIAIGDTAIALRESSRGRHLADACGFGLLSIDLRLAHARALLAAGSASAACDVAQDVVARAEDPACGYAWAVADAWHLIALGSRSREAAVRAARLRTRLGHPGAPASSALARRDPPAAECGP